VAKILGQTPDAVKRMLRKPKVDIPSIFRALGYQRINSNKDKNERVRQFFVLKAPNPSGRDKRYYVGSAEASTMSTRFGCIHLATRWWASSSSRPCVASSASA